MAPISCAGRGNRLGLCPLSVPQDQIPIDEARQFLIKPAQLLIEAATMHEDVQIDEVFPNEPLAVERA